MLNNLSGTQEEAAQGDTSLKDTSAIAPWWHFAALLAVLGIKVVLSPRFFHIEQLQRHTEFYLTAISGSWLVFGAAVAGVYSRRRFFFEALQRGARPWTVELARGAAIYVGLFILNMMSAGLLQAAHYGVDQSVVKAMGPQSATELLLWVVMSVSAGISEEFVHRGYLLRQSLALVQKLGAPRGFAAVVAVMFTSLLFGCGHLYQGIEGAATVTLFGIVTAIMALQFGNLRAVIIAHVMQDVFGGVILFALRHHAT